MVGGSSYSERCLQFCTVVFPIAHASCGLGNTAGAVPSVLCPSAPGLAGFGQGLGCPWDKGASLLLFSVELGAFCIYVFVRMYIATRAFLRPTLELAEGPLPNSRLLGPSLDRPRLGQTRPLSPQHCARHRRPPSETHDCLCRPGLRPPPLGSIVVPSQHLSKLDLGPLYPLGLCQSVTRDWADPGTHQSTAQAAPDGSASAFQLPGCLVPHAGPCTKDTSCRNAPAQAVGRGEEVVPAQLSNIPDSPLKKRHMCPAIIHPSLCVPVGCVCECVRVCEGGWPRCVCACTPGPGSGPSQMVMAILVPVLG